MTVPSFRSFNSTETPFLPQNISPTMKVLLDARTGAPTGLQSANANGPNGIWAPVDLTAAQIASPSAAMIADLNAVYRLNAAPYTRYYSDGTNLVSSTSSPIIPDGSVISLATFATFGPGVQDANAAAALIALNDEYHDNVLTIQNDSVWYWYDGAGTTVNGNPNVTIASTTGILAGNYVSGPGITAGTTVLSVTDATHFAMSANAGVGAGTGTVKVERQRGNAALRFLQASNTGGAGDGYERGAIGYSHAASYGQGFHENSLYIEIGNLKAADPDDTSFIVVNTHVAGATNFPSTNYVALEVTGSTGDFYIRDHLAVQGIFWDESLHRTDFGSSDAATALSIRPGTTGTPVTLIAAGTDTNIAVRIDGKGSGLAALASRGSYAVVGQNPATPVNYNVFNGSATGTDLSWVATGSDMDISIALTPKAAGVVKIIGDGAADLFINPGAASTPIQLLASGSDTSIAIRVDDKGGAGIFLASRTAYAFQAVNPASPVNYSSIAGSAVGQPIRWTAIGTDTNIDMRVVPKGSGVLYLDGAAILVSAPPASAGAAGVAGTVTWASGFLYVCVATNTWQRVAIATW